MVQQRGNLQCLPLAILIFLCVGFSSLGSEETQVPPVGDTGLSFVPGEVLVQFKESSKPSSTKESRTALSQTKALSARVRDRYGLTEKSNSAIIHNANSSWRLYRTNGNLNQVCAELRADPDVVAVQPNYIYRICRTPSDPEFPDQYAHQLIHMEDAWDISTGSRDIVVAVLDTGVDVNHPDLRDNIWINAHEIPGNGIDDDGNGYIDDIHGWNFEDDSNQVNPANEAGGWGSILDHGTMVAGVIAAVGNNDVGVTGVNWQCSIMALRLSMEVTSAEVAAGLQYAAANGAHVVNMSFSADEFGPEGDPIVNKAIDEADQAGVLLVASAGNDDTGRPHYPAAYYNVMAVSSTDGEDMKTGHSSFGSWVDIAAPGTDIVTTTFEEEYIATAGTSFSAPYVGAVAALVMAANPERSALEVRAILENTADEVYYGEVDSSQGYIGTGRVNAHSALQVAGQALPLGEIISPRPRQTYTPIQESILVRVLIQGDSYTLTYRGLGQETWIEIRTGTEPSLDPPILDIAVPNLGVGVYELRLVTTGNDYQHTDTKIFGVELATHQPHWPKPEKAEFPPSQFYQGSPLCLDLTGDGQHEIILSSLDFLDFFSMNSSLNAWTADGNDLPGWPIQMEYFVPGALAIGDIDGDGGYELIATDDYGEIMAWCIENQRPMTGHWPASPGGWSSNIVAPPVLADLDQDGDSEIIVALNNDSGSSDGLHAIQHDGSYLWQRRYTTEGPMSVADIDRDGQVELVLSGYGPGISNLYTFLLNNQGQLIKKWKGGSHMGTVIADLDGDSEYELIFCYAEGVQAVHRDGKTLWKKRVYGPFGDTGRLSVGDTDGDGRAEIYVNTYVEADGYTYTLLYAFDHRGQLLAQRGYPKTLMGVPVQCTPLIADLDGNGQREVLAAAAGAPLMAWEADGSTSPGFPMLNVVPYFSGPIVADLDQDGDAEILMTLDDYRFGIVDLPGTYQANAMDWVLPHHDLQNSGWLASGPSLDPVSIPSEVKPGQKISLPLTVTNPTGHPYQLFVGSLPPGAHYEPNTTTIHWKPTLDQVFQTYRLSFLATNGVHQDAQGLDITVQPDAIYATDMSEDPDWQLDEGWTWGKPTGAGSWNGDPNGAFTGDNAIGFNLGGDYSDNMATARYATLGPIDCSAYQDIRLSFRRWLGLESPYDQAAVQISNDGTTWVDLWTNGQSHIADRSWQFVELEVPAATGDRQVTVYFRWGLGPTDDSVTYPGWNIDDVQVTGDRLPL